MAHPQDDKTPEKSAVTDRTCQVLKYLGTCGLAGARLLDITRATGLTRPAATRMLRAMSDNGFVLRDAGRRYILGPEVFMLGLAALNPIRDLDPLRQIVRDLAQEVGDIAYLSIRRGESSHYLLREEGAYPIRAYMIDVGEIKSLVQTYGGLTFLATMSPAEAERIISRALPQDDAETRARQKSLLQVVERARCAGYITGPDLVLRDVDGIGLSIPAPNGTAFLALTISAIRSRLDEERIRILLPKLRAAADRIRKVLDEGAALDLG